MGFSEDIEKFAKKCGSNADKVVRKTIIDISASLVKRSPVGDPSTWLSLGVSSRFMNKAGTKRLKRAKLEYARKPPEGYVGGHFRGNWQLGKDSMPMGEVSGEDKNGGKTINKIISQIPDQAATVGVYYIANNLPYGPALEEGHSKQAPLGIVGLTKLEFQGIIKEAVEKLK